MRSICTSCGRELDGESCEQIYHRLLVREQQDPALGRYHGVAVPAYLLQHAHEAGTSAAVRDGQFRMLQLFVARGIDGMLRVRTHVVRNNSHRASGPGTAFAASMREFDPLPDRPPPRLFAVDVGHLAGPDDFAPEGYDDRVRALATATLTGWREPPTA